MKKMKKHKVINCLACMTLLSASGAVDISPFGVDVDLGVRSAYHSRMRVSNDRPVFVQDIRMHADAGAFGKFGVLHWGYSSLCNRRSHVHRRAFNEVDFAAFWKRDIELTEDFTLANEFMHWWITLPQNIEPYKGDADNSTYELWYVGSLKNPYLVPSVLVRRGWINKSWVYFRYGVSRAFEICDFGSPDEPRPLVVTPGFFVETGDSGLFESRFGKKESGSYHSGIGSCIAQVALKWQAAEHFSIYAMLQQFDLVSSDARAGVHGDHHRDYTMFRLGMNLAF